MRAIYLDHHATTPCDPRVVAAMIPFFSEDFGNPASTTHVFGQKARSAVDAARAEVAALVGGSPAGVTFTSGATEALNLALQGLSAAAGPARPVLIVSAIEHAAVLDTARALARRGAALVILPVDAEARVDPASLEAALRIHASRTALIAVMAANNEVGTVQPIAELAALAASFDVPFVCDAVQGIGKLEGPPPLSLPGVAAVALSAHKFGGPKGVGALCVRSRPPLLLEPLHHGGAQERGLRPGTVATHQVVGLGEAARLLGIEGPPRVATETARRDDLWDALHGALGDGVVRNTPLKGALPNNLHVSFPGVESRALMAALPHLAFSAGSACHTGSGQPSHVLGAMGLPAGRALSAARFGLSHTTLAEEVEVAAAALVDAVVRLRR
jgi:cysteine desulfurase